MSGGMKAHEVLGISPRASAREIRQAYKRLARQYHPDRNPSAEAAEMFKAVKAAHDRMLAGLDNPTPAPGPRPGFSTSPGFSSSRGSAARTHRTTSTSSAGRRSPHGGPRWRGPGSGDPGPAWSRTGAGPTRATGRSASRQSEPRIRIIEPDLDLDSVEVNPDDLYRSSIWIVAVLGWCVMFLGFVLTLRAFQASPDVDEPSEPVEQPADPE